MIHKKRKSVHVFASLARLAYNKGTALFRGNDPLWRSAAETFSSIINTSTQTKHARCGSHRNGVRNMAKPLMYSTCPQMNTSATRGLFYRSVSLHTDRRFHALWVSLLLLNAAFVLSCWINWSVTWVPEKYGPEPKESEEEVRQASLSALLSESCSLCGHHTWY